MSAFRAAAFIAIVAFMVAMALIVP